jgi:hypothetical protein
MLPDASSDAWTGANGCRGLKNYCKEFAPKDLRLPGGSV